MATGHDHLRAREVEAEHQVGRDTIDDVAVDERRRRHHLAVDEGILHYVALRNGYGE